VAVTPAPTHRYRYVTRVTRDTDDSLGGVFGALDVDDRRVLSTWALDASVAEIEADPCMCGVPGCGRWRYEVRRCGEWVVWTCWSKADDTPAPHAYDTLVLDAGAYQEALGGDVTALPPLDARHAHALLLDLRGAPPAPFFWDAEAPGSPTPEALLEALDDPARYVGASLVQAPTSCFLLLDDHRKPVLALAHLDGAWAVQRGVLLDLGLMLRLPALDA